MDAVYGYVGARDARIEAAMDAALAHRGVYRHVIRAGNACVGYRGPSKPPASKATISGSRLALVSGSPDFGTTDEPHGARAGGLNEAVLNAIAGAFIWVDWDGQQLTLVRDPAGERTVYYGVYDGCFVFASEPKAVLAVPGFPRRLRPGALAQYLSFSFVPGSQTMLVDLAELPAGHLLRWSPGDRSPTPKRYFHFERPSATAGQSATDWPGAFRSQLGAIVRQRLLAHDENDDAPVGSFLSGGLDSSVVTAELARQTRRPVHSYSIHFGEHYPNELPFARAVAESVGTIHHELDLRPREFLPRLRQMIWHLDDPIGDPITMPNFELASRAANECRQIFNGEGGDPIFGGPKNIPMLLHHWYGGVNRGARFREEAYLQSYRRGYEEISRLLTPEFRRLFNVDEELTEPLTPFFECPHARGFLDKLCAINIRMKGAHLILPKVERMLGAWRVQAEAPLFDASLIRMSYRMPNQMRLKDGIEKVVIKDAYRNVVPLEVVLRPKSGMRVPVHYWFQGELKRYARRVLSPRSLKRQGIFDPDRVRELLRYDTQEGPGRYGLRLWMLLTFELWRRMVIDGEAV
ncbi:MAG: asparagine synthase-related protein [Pseudomonadota bacterium]